LESIACKIQPHPGTEEFSISVQGMEAVSLEAQLPRTLRQEDCLSPGVEGQAGQHSEILSGKRGRKGEGGTEGGREDGRLERGGRKEERGRKGRNIQKGRKDGTKEEREVRNKNARKEGRSKKNEFFIYGI
jgi:hypothetical protein